MLININDIKGIVYLGVQNETLVTQINIDCSSWLNDYPNGILSIEAKRPNDTTAYVCNTVINNNILTWNINLNDTAQNGYGTFQVKLTDNDSENIKLTKMIRTLIDDSLTGYSSNRAITLPTWVMESKSANEETVTSKLLKLEDLKNIVLLGIQGERYVNDIRIDCERLRAEYPNGIFSIIAQRPNEKTTYLADTETIGNILVWHVTNYDTGIEGLGTFQIRLDEQDKVKFTKIARTRIFESQKGTFDPNPPVPTPSWIDDVMDAAERAEQSAKDIEDLTVHGHALPSTSQPTVTKTKIEGQPYHLEFGLPSFSGESIVRSVNGKTGDVVLDVNDIKVREALMDGTLKVPTRALEVAASDMFILNGGSALD